MAMPDVVERYWTREDAHRMPDEGNKLRVHRWGAARDARSVVRSCCIPLEAIRLGDRGIRETSAAWRATVSVARRRRLEPHRWCNRLVRRAARRQAWIGSAARRHPRPAPSRSRYSRPAPPASSRPQARVLPAIRRAGVLDRDHDARLVERWRPRTCAPRSAGDARWSPEAPSTPYESTSRALRRSPGE